MNRVHVSIHDAILSVVPPGRDVKCPNLGIEHRNECQDQLLKLNWQLWATHMPHYFFHLQDGKTILDDQGVDLPDVDAAGEEAIRACGDMLRDMPRALYNGDPICLWVSNQPDGKGRKLFMLTVAARWA